MGFYKLEIKKSVFKDLKHIDKHLVKQILLKIEALKENPRGNQSQKLHGTECSHRLRVGDYRIIYQIDDIQDVMRTESMISMQEYISDKNRLIDAVSI